MSLETNKTWKVRTVDLRQLERHLNEMNGTIFGIYPSVNLSGSVEVVSYVEDFLPKAPGYTTPIHRVKPWGQTDRQTAKEVKAAEKAAKVKNDKVEAQAEPVL